MLCYLENRSNYDKILKVKSFDARAHERLLNFKMTSHMYAHGYRKSLRYLLILTEDQQNLLYHTSVCGG